MPGKKRSHAQRAKDETRYIMGKLDLIEGLADRLEPERIEDICDSLEREVASLRERMRARSSQRSFSYRDEREASPSAESDSDYRVT